MRMTAARLVALATVAAVATAGLAFAGDNVFRFGGGFVSPTGDLRVSETTRIPGTFPQDVTDTTSAEFDGNAGLTVSFERRINESIGLEVQLGHSMHGLDVVVDQRIVDVRSGNELFSGQLDAFRGETEIAPVSLTLNIYLDNRENYDVVFGASVIHMQYGDLKFPSFSSMSSDGGSGGPSPTGLFDGSDVELADDFAFGAVLGVELYLGDRWRFRALGRYINAQADFNATIGGETSRIELDVNPISTEFTFGIKF